MRLALALAAAFGAAFVAVSHVEPSGAPHRGTPPPLIPFRPLPAPPRPVRRRPPQFVVVSFDGAGGTVSFANHFETWNHWAYDRALSRFVLESCRLPEVRCVTLRELVDWLDAQPPARLRRFRAGRFRVYRP